MTIRRAVKTACDHCIFMLGDTQDMAKRATNRIISEATSKGNNADAQSQISIQEETLRCFEVAMKAVGDKIIVPIRTQDGKRVTKNFSLYQTRKAAIDGINNFINRENTNYGLVIEPLQTADLVYKAIIGILLKMTVTGPDHTEWKDPPPEPADKDQKPEIIDTPEQQIAQQSLREDHPVVDISGSLNTPPPIPSPENTEKNDPPAASAGGNSGTNLPPLSAEIISKAKDHARMVSREVQKILSYVAEHGKDQGNASAAITR